MNTTQPALLFLGRNPADLAIFHHLVRQVGGTEVGSVAAALGLMRRGELTAMIIGDDVDDEAALRVIRLARRVQPVLPVIVCGTRTAGSAVRAHATRLVARALLAAALCGVLLEAAPNELLPSFRHDLLRRRRTRRASRGKLRVAPYAARVRRAVAEQSHHGLHATHAMKQAV